MPRTRMLIAALAAGLVATGAIASAIPEDRGVLTKPLIPMKGSAASASGELTVQVDPKAMKFCYAIDARGVDATDAVLQKGNSTILKLTKSRAGSWDGCADITQDVGRAIVASPGDYSVTVNNGALSTKLSG